MSVVAVISFIDFTAIYSDPVIHEWGKDNLWVMGCVLQVHVIFTLVVFRSSLYVQNDLPRQ